MIISYDFTVETPIHSYQNDKDFDEAFKNLLRPIESITKKKNCEPHQYNLLKVIKNFKFNICYIF